MKDTRWGESRYLQLRAEFFNVWNWHIFSSSGAWAPSSFDTDLQRHVRQVDGTVTKPRNIQVGVRITF